MTKKHAEEVANTITAMLNKVYPELKGVIETYYIQQDNEMSLSSGNKEPETNNP